MTDVRRGQLLRRGQARGAGADDRDFLPGANVGRLGMDPAFRESAIDDGLFDLLDRHRRLIDPQHARRFARARDRCGR